VLEARDRLYMHHFNNKKKKNNVITATAAVTTAIILIVATTATVSTTTITTPLLSLAYAWIDPDPQPRSPKVPPVISGENVYIVWWTDRGTVNANGEVMFRASTDGGATFSDKINLSNTTDADSIDAEIAAEGANVIVTWWEHNQTSDIPVARISEDAGETFGPLLMLGANGTIGVTEEEEGETVEEEAVGGEEVAE
jgi:hypothetical protein